MFLLYKAFLVSTLLLSVQQSDRSDKACTVTSVTKDGVHSNCNGWKPARGEKLEIPPLVLKQLRAGDLFYLVWKGTRWVAEIKETVAVTISPDEPAIILSRLEAEFLFKKLCADGANDQILKALAAELNPMPDWPQMVINGDSSVCNRSPKPLVIQTKIKE